MIPSLVEFLPFIALLALVLGAFGTAIALAAVVLIRELNATAGAHRKVIGELVEASQSVKARLTQIETQLGRTMRAVGVPGQPE